MGASSSGLLDDTKISHIKGLVDSSFQSFSGFYRQQYSVAYLGYLHQEVEPNKEGRGLLLTQRPPYNPEEVLYQENVKISCWDEQGKKCRERYVVLRRDYNVEIHDNMEAFNRGCAAKLVLQPAGGILFTTEKESRAQLEKTCTGILNGVKEDTSSGILSPDIFAVYLHLPYTGHTCFLFQQAEKRDHFLSDLKTCIKHSNIDPWHTSSHESKAYAHALRLYQQEKGCYESWEKLLGTEEQVLASQVMEELLPWLQSQLQSKVKGKKTERIRQWLATMQATYALVSEHLTAGLETLREDCRKTASASQALIRSDLDQIMTSQHFLEQKVRACIYEEAEKVCSESIGPYLSSILEVLTGNIGAGILGMQHTLRTQMDSAFSLTNGGTEETKKVLTNLHSISLDESYKKVEDLMEKLTDLKQRFGLSSAKRLVHSAHLEMEKLLDSAVYTLEQFLQSSTKLQPSEVPLKMDRAKERVFKQLDYDSRVVQRRLYQEALLEITLPSLTRRMDSKWKSDLQQFEQYIFSDYSNFILVHNIYDDVLRNILTKEIETVVQDAASKKSNNLLLDTSDLAISQYSLLGQTPPHSTPDTPVIHTRSSSGPNNDQEAPPVVEDRDQLTDVSPQNDAELKVNTKPDPSISQASDHNTILQCPVIVLTEAPQVKEITEEGTVRCDTPSSTDSTQTVSYNSEAAVTHEVDTANPQTDPGSTIPDQPDPQIDLGSTIPDQPHPQIDLGSTIPDQPHPQIDLGSTIPDQPHPQIDLGSTIPDQPDPQIDLGSTIPDQPDPQIDLGSTIPDQPDPQIDLGSTIPDQPDPQIDLGSTIPDQPHPQTDLGSTIPDQPHPQTDPGSTIPDQPHPQTDPGSTIPDQPHPQTDLGSTIPDQPHPQIDQGSTIPDQPHPQTEPGSTIPDQPDPQIDQGSTIPHSPDPSPLALPQLTNVHIGCNQNDHSATPEKPTTPYLSSSDQISEEASSTQSPSPSHSPEIDYPMKISLGSLMDGIAPCSKEPVMKTLVQQPTDRAVYLTGEIKDNWEVERVKEQQQKEATEKEGCEMMKEGRKEEEKGEEQAKGVAQTAGETINEDCSSSSSPRDGDVVLTPGQTVSEGLEDKSGHLESEFKGETQKDDEKNLAKEDLAKEEEEKEEVLQSSQPVEPQVESAAEPPLGSVAIIRELVTEITEVETAIAPCPTSSSNTP
ncbi:protein Niban 1-like [Melanotaenia boesemani]|uniref:protein Niban 1-like n=1 Tax=Melanotaenia boesemani TaxID=1250792 RepID=UPI001C03E824|nr:protein Niban 1-like [Melanotaenia boesemani]